MPERSTSKSLSLSERLIIKIVKYARLTIFETLRDIAFKVRIRYSYEANVIAEMRKRNAERIHLWTDERTACGLVLAHGEKKFRATQVWEWLYTKRVASFSEMSNISKSLMTLLEENFSLNPLKQVIVQEAQDGTVKYLFELPDKNMIETVLMRQEYGLSVCVTTQVGCNIGCTFCASGLLKTKRFNCWRDCCPNYVGATLFR